MKDDKNPARLWTRREAIQRVSALLGGTTLIGQTAMLAGCDSSEQVAVEAEPDAGIFSAADIEFLGEIAETILPETETPGAQAAGVGPFIALMVTDTYDGDEQRIFKEGLGALNDACREAYGDSFTSVTPEQRLELLTRLDKEQFEAMQQRSSDAPVHYFRMLKELTMLGYFTSEIGYTQAMRYTETPGRFEPCTPLKPGDKVWAAHA